MTAAAAELRARVFAAAALHRAAEADATGKKVRRLIAAGGAAVALLAAALRARRITREQFIAQATAALREHAEAAGRLGAARFGSAGDFDPAALSGIDASDFADTVLDRGNSDAQVAAWALGAAGIAWRLFQAGVWAGGTAAGIASWDWAEDPASQHCEDPDGQDCPTFAANGPYTAATKPADPGDGTTPCSSGCRCGWEPHEEDA